MYKIYYSINGSETMFFRDDLPIDDYKLVDTTLKLAVNSAGSLDFLMPTINVMYDKLQRMRGLIKVKKNDKLVWEGRVLSEDTDFWQNKTVYCEGILACLNDTRHPQLLYKDLTLRQYMEALLSIHNQKVDESKRFQIGIVTANGNADVGTRTTSYESTWELFKGLVDEYGGYLFVRYDGETRYIDFRKECPRTSSQKIEFGVNLMDFTRSYDMSTLCTVLLPLGKMITSAGNNTIGGVIDSRLADGHYIDPDDFNIYYDPGLAGAYAASNTYFPVEAGKNYYISCRNHDGRVMWALKDASGNLVDSYTARTGEGFTDLVEHKLEIPPSDVGNMYQLAIAGFGADIQPRVNESIEADEAFDKYTTVEEANNGSMYVVNEEAVTNYGWIEKQLTWNNIDDPNELKRVSEAYLKDGQFDEMTINLTAVDLQMMGVDTNRIDILDEVWVVSNPHGLNKTFPVTELTIKMSEQSANKFTLGSKTEQTLSGVMADANDDIFAKLNAIPSQSATLKSAKDNATMLINNAVSGIFMLEYNDEGVNTGFRISNVPDWNADGAKGWRFTMGGLGFFGDGFDKPVTLALTGEDGGIVANCITSGTMYGDRIYGGTLTLGGYNNDNGILLVRNTNGDDICRFDNTGGYINGVLYTENTNTKNWLRLENGSLYGGNSDEQLAVIDTNASILDGDNDILYRGLQFDSDVIYLACKFFAINGATGTTGYLNYVGDVSFTTSQISIVTDAYIDGNGELQLVKNTIEYVSGWSWYKTGVYFKNGIMCTSLEDWATGGTDEHTSGVSVETGGTGGSHVYPPRDILDGYTQVTYVESTGTQGINTGYSVTSGSVTLKADIEFTVLLGGYNTIFGTWDNNNTHSPHFWLTLSPEENYAISITNRNATNYVYRNIYGEQAQTGKRYQITAVISPSEASLTVNDATTTGISWGAGTSVIGLLQNGTIGGNNASAKLYGAKIYDSNTLVRDFVPAVRNADGVAGLYDVVNNVFYTNAGDGDFIVKL